MVLGVYYKLQTFIYLSANGIIQGIRPLISFNYGAKENRRVQKIFLCKGFWCYTSCSTSLSKSVKELYVFTFSGCFFISSTSRKASIVSLFGISLDTSNVNPCSLIACLAAIVKNVVKSNPKSLISSCNCAFKVSSILIVIFVFAIISLFKSVYHAAIFPLLSIPQSRRYDVSDPFPLHHS